MRYFVSLLVIINIGIWAYFNQDVFYQATPSAAHTEIDPDKMHLLTEHQLDLLPKTNAATPAPVATPLEITPPAQNNVSVAEATSCYEWGIFTKSNIDNAQTTANKLLLQATLKEHTPTEAKRYWVYLPKLKSTQAAQDKADELRNMGVSDLYILQDSKWKNAISFGIFEDETLATKLYEDLKAKGVKNVTKSQREQGSGNFSLYIKNATTTDIGHLKDVKTEFPEAEIKEVGCE
jgi:hypothetical protein